MSPLRAAPLEHALRALDMIADVVAGGREAFDASEQIQLAVAMCWVSVGSQLKQADRLNGERTPGFRAAIRFRDRLSYSPLARMRADILWQTSVEHGPEMRELLSSLIHTALR